MEANENSGERKIKRFKVRERERGGSGKEGEPVSIPLMPFFHPLFGQLDLSCQNVNLSIS